jgi:hypothetical protein
VVAVSSNVTYLEFATVLGADASLLKPFLPDKLKSTLNQLGIAPD